MWDSYTVSGEAGDVNIISGHGSDSSGIYHRRGPGWIVNPPVEPVKYDWLLSSELYNTVRFERAYQHTVAGAGSYKLGLSINHGASGQVSEWGVALAIMYDRQLNITERLQVGVACAAARNMHYRQSLHCNLRRREGAGGCGWRPAPASLLQAGTCPAVAIAGSYTKMLQADSLAVPTVPLVSTVSTVPQPQRVTLGPTEVIVVWQSHRHSSRCMCMLRAASISCKHWLAYRAGMLLRSAAQQDAWRCPARVLQGGYGLCHTAVPRHQCVATTTQVATTTATRQHGSTAAAQQ